MSKKDFKAKIDEAIKNMKPTSQETLDELEAYRKREDEEKRLLKQCRDRIAEILREYFHTKEEGEALHAIACAKHGYADDTGIEMPRKALINNLKGPSIVASVMEYFDIGNSREPGQLYVEWAYDHYVTKKLKAVVPDMIALYDMLVEKGIGIDNMFDYNDLDNQIFYLNSHPDLKVKAFCIETQNWNYVFVLRNRYADVWDVHFRKYWHQMEFDDAYEMDEWKRIHEKDGHEGTMQQAIIRADWLKQYYSDNLPGNQYVDRPDLQSYLEFLAQPDYEMYEGNHRGIHYEDSRDRGYILTCRSLGNDIGSRDKVDNAIYFYVEIKYAFFYLLNAIEMMQAGEFDG